MSEKKLFESLGDAVDFEKKMLRRGVTPEMVKMAKSSKAILENIALVLKAGVAPSIIWEWIDEKTIRIRPLILNYDQTVEQMIAKEGLVNDGNITSIHFPNCKKKEMGTEEIELFLIAPVPRFTCYSITEVEQAIDKAGFKPADLAELSLLKNHMDDLRDVGIWNVIVLDEKSRWWQTDSIENVFVPYLRLGIGSRGFELSKLEGSGWGPGNWFVVRRKGLLY